LGVSITVTGTLERIRAVLFGFKGISNLRSNSGYDPADNSFLYRYICMEDSTVCEECLFNEASLISGDMIATVFPDAKHIGLGVWFVNHHPNCRCLLVAELLSETCAQKLSNELSTTNN